MQVNNIHTTGKRIPRQVGSTMVFVFTFLLCGILSYAQNVSNRGKEFWVGYGHHQFMENGTNTQNMVLYLSAEDQPATVTVTIDSSGFGFGTWWRKTYTIPAFTVIKSDIIPKGTNNLGAPGDPPSDPNYDARLYTDPPPAGTGGAGVFRKKGIHIESNVPIVAYAHIYGSTSSGATMLLPVTAWGYSYVSLNSKQDYLPDCYNWMYVVASKDNTLIQITTPVVTRAQDKTGLSPGNSIMVNLMKGQIYQVIGANDGANGNGNGGTASTGKQLTGTTVRSMANGSGDCNPIAVFAGSSRTSNPASCGSGGGDNDNQQLFPQHAWGKRYYTAPFSGADDPLSFGVSTYKVAVRDPATIVKRNGINLTGLTGNFYVFESSTADVIEADKPIEVMQFMTGGSCLGSGGLGDPEMVVLSPVEQAIKRVGFFRNNKESITVNYVTLIVPTAGVSSLQISGAGGTVTQYPHPKAPGYTVVMKRWNSPLPPAAPLGQCIVTCDSAFTGITYGEGSFESYAFNVGTYLNNLNAVGSVHNQPDTSNGGNNRHAFTCVGTPVKLSALIRYQPLKLVWNLSALGNVVSPNADTTINPASDIYGGTVTVNGILYYKYTLPNTYYFNTPGTYEIPIKSTSLSLDNCNNTEELKISVEVKPKPTANFTFSHPTGCIKDTVFFAGPASTGSYTIGQWNWTFANGGKDSVQNPAKLLTTTGQQPVKLTVVTADGCLADTSKQIIIYAPPTVTINATPAVVCQGSAITFSETAAYGGPVAVNKWYWDFGNGTTATPANGNPQTVTYSTYGAYTTKHVAKVSDLCVSDTATVPVTVYAKPIPGFSYPAGCLPANGLVQFTDTSKVPDAQPITSWSWNFGDPNATGANPNTSTQQSPTHTYTFGNYTITFSVTTANGCTKDTTVAATFSLRPQLTYAALPAVCENVTAPVSVAAAAVTNGVPGAGIYRGPGTTAAGVFTPSVAGAGTHTLTYVFTTTGGCKDSVTSTITVYPKPVAAFTVNAGICLNQSATFTDQSTISSGTITSWNWNFGDGNWVANNNNNSFTKSWTAANTYTVKLVTVSDHGCISDTTVKVVAVYPMPSADFTVTHPTGCIKDTVRFTGPASTSGYTISKWSWVFAGGVIDSVQNPVRLLTTTGAQNVTLTVTTTNGCVATVTKPITIYAPPVTTLTATPATVCQGENITFSETSSYAGPVAINTWYWDYGNGTMVTAANGNPTTYAYPNYGMYTAKHVVKVSSACVSDTSEIPVRVFAKPNLGVSYPVGCLPLNGVVQFTDTSKAPDMQTIAAWNWNFGDPNATAGNPNTSTQQNPSHIYTAFGNYNIHFTAFTINGCSRDTIIAATFAIRPRLSYPALNAVCINAGNVSVATATVTNGVPGTGVYSGPGTTAAGAFNPAVAGVGTHLITYTFTSTGGCTETIKSSITVNPKPVAAFTANSDICLNQSATFTDQSTIASGAITAWKWNFGDGIWVTNTSNASFTKSWIAYGTYSVKLVAVSDQGCTSDTVTRLVTVHPLPVTDFSLPVAVCMPGGLAEFKNNTTVADNAALGYTWNFGDNSAVSHATNATHTYASTGSYNVQLVATSSWGCTSQATKILSSFFDKPVAAFTVAPDTLCQGAESEFTDESTAGNNSVSGWNWNFGDGSSSTQQNPVKRYSSPGAYTVQLQVANSVGCASEIASRQVVVYLQPVIDAGPSFVVPEGTVIQFNPSANDSTVLKFNWSPAPGLNNAAKLRPVLQALYDQTYTLTATGEGLCTASDKLTVKILKPVTIPNAFSPNGDGIHDTWVITNLSDYPGCTVEVFNRYGQRVFYSSGYGTPWNGTFSGKPLPMATYYYVIHLKNGFTPKSGSITIVK